MTFEEGGGLGDGVGRVLVAGEVSRVDGMGGIPISPKESDSAP